MFQVEEIYTAKDQSIIKCYHSFNYTIEAQLIIEKILQKILQPQATSTY